MRLWIDDSVRNTLYSNLYSFLENNAKTQMEREVNILGLKFIQYPGVFPADEFADTEIFSKAIQVLPGEDFLEIGVGSGITSVLAATNGAKVVGVDINDRAISNSKANALLHNVVGRTEFFTSDVFSEIPSRNFDTIYWNVPFCYSDVSDLSTFEKCVFDFQYKSLNEFIKNSKSFLKPDGRLLIGFSHVWGLQDKLFRMLHESGYSNFQIVHQKMVNWNSVTFDLTLYEIQNTK